MNGHDIVVLGASAGGVEALSRVVRGFPADLPAAVFVVLHIAPGRVSALAAILGRESVLPAAQAEDGAPVSHGRIYVAAPDRHLVVRPGHIALSSGPAENRVRPSVDTLFRSAAVAYPGRTIGVVLTGHLDDGAAGLAAIKRSAGIAVVQDPSEAFAPSMPRSALDATEVDHVAVLDQMGPLIARLSALPAPANASAPPELIRETATQLGATRQAPHQGRDNAGHAFTARPLLDGLGDGVEHALWVALRTLEERIAILELLARDQAARDRRLSSRQYQDRADQLKTHMTRIRELLLGGLNGDRAALQDPPD